MGVEFRNWCIADSIWWHIWHYLSWTEGVFVVQMSKRLWIDLARELQTHIKTTETKVLHGSMSGAMCLMSCKFTDDKPKWFIHMGMQSVVQGMDIYCEIWTVWSNITLCVCVLTCYWRVNGMLCLANFSFKPKTNRNHIRTQKLVYVAIVIQFRRQWTIRDQST